MSTSENPFAALINTVATEPAPATVYHLTFFYNQLDGKADIVDILSVPVLPDTFALPEMSASAKIQFPNLTFIGWCRHKDGRDRIYKANEQYTMQQAEEQLFAIWDEAATPKIVYTDHVGNLSSEETTLLDYYKLKTPESSGFAFWIDHNRERFQGGVCVPASSTETLHLAAVWHAYYYIRLDGCIPSENGNTHYPAELYTEKSDMMHGYATCTAYTSLNGIPQSTYAELLPQCSDIYDSLYDMPPAEESICQTIQAHGLSFDSQTQGVVWYVSKLEADGIHIDGIICPKYLPETTDDTATIDLPASVSDISNVAIPAAPLKLDENSDIIITDDFSANIDKNIDEHLFVLDTGDISEEAPEPTASPKAASTAEPKPAFEPDLQADTLNELREVLRKNKKAAFCAAAATILTGFAYAALKHRKRKRGKRNRR